jgi:predicted  nucleic acid-binding Zn-ribbon protein
MSRKFSPSNRGEAKTAALTDNDSDHDDTFPSKRSRSSRLKSSRKLGTKSVTPTSGTKQFASGRFTPKSKPKLVFREPTEFFAPKTRPRVVSLDKERLYEEVLSLKQTVNKLKHENTRLKTKAAQFERELSRKDAFLNELKSSNAFPAGLGSISVISNLKSAVKDLQEELKQKDAEVSLMRRRMQATRTEEMETELQVYADECTRLKHRLTEVMRFYKADEHGEDDLAELVYNMKEDREGLEAELDQAQREISKWRARVMELEEASKKLKNSDTLKQEVRKLKSALETVKKAKDEAEQTAAEAKDSLERKLQSKQTDNDRLRRELDAVKRQHEEQIVKAAAANKAAVEAKEKTKELSLKLEALKEKTGFSLSEAKALALSILKKLEDNKESIEGFAAEAGRTSGGLLSAIERRSVDFRDPRAAISRVFDDLEISSERVLRWLRQYPAVSLSPKPSPAAQPSPVRSPLQPNLSLDLSQIKRKQTKDLLRHISLRMQLHRIPKRKLMTVMFGDHVDKAAVVPHDELVSILTQTPFSMTPAESDQVADFLLSTHKTAVAIIGCLFFELDDWQVLRPEDEEALDEQIAELLGGVAAEFREACEALDVDKSGTISMEDYFQILEALQIELTDTQLQYLRLLFYSHKFDFESVPYHQLLSAYTVAGSVSADSASSTSELVNSCLAFVSNALRSQGKTPDQVFKTDQTGLIWAPEFYNGLQTLGHPDIERKEFLAIMEALNSEEEEELCVQISYFTEILRHYEDSEASSAEKERYISVLGSSDHFSYGSLSGGHQEKMMSIASQYEEAPSSYNFTDKLVDFDTPQNFSPTVANLKAAQSLDADALC